MFGWVIYADADVCGLFRFDDFIELDLIFLEYCIINYWEFVSDVICDTRILLNFL